MKIKKSFPYFFLTFVQCWTSHFMAYGHGDKTEKKCLKTKGRTCLVPLSNDKPKPRTFSVPEKIYTFFLKYSTSTFFSFSEVLRISEHEQLPVSSIQKPNSRGQHGCGLGGRATPVVLQQWNQTRKLASTHPSPASSSSSACHSPSQCYWPQQPRVLRCNDAAFVRRLSTAHWGQVLLDGGGRQVALGLSEMCGVWGGIRDAIFLLWTRWSHLLQRRLPKVRKPLLFCRLTPLPLFKRSRCEHIKWMQASVTRIWSSF